MSTFVSLDIETTGLDPRRHEMWEIGMCGLKAGEYFEDSFVLEPSKGAVVDPEAMRINNYYGRKVDGLPPSVDKGWLAQHLRVFLDNAYIIAKNPAFDTAFITQFFEAQKIPKTRPWHHRMTDITSLAYGWYFGKTREWSEEHTDGTVRAFEDPPSGERVREMTGIEISAPDHHTALGDAKWNWEVFQKITGV